MKVKELYDYCTEHDESLVAHYILHELQKERITFDDDINKLQKPDTQAVLTMANQNILGINPIKIYSLKEDGKTFVFIFAKSTKEAIKHFTKLFNKSPKNCIELSLDTQMARGNQFLSFRDMRKEIKKIPALIGYYERV